MNRREICFIGVAPWRKVCAGARQPICFAGWRKHAELEARDVISADDIRFMELAIAQAEEALAAGEVPVGAVVVCDGEVVAADRNRREESNDPSAHAELLAMRSAAESLGRWRLSNCTVYVTLEPCIMCAGAMVQARIARCVFGAFDPKGGGLDSLYALHDDPRLNHSFAVNMGVLEDRCQELLDRFFAEKRQ